MRITTAISACLFLAACGEVHSFIDAGDSTFDAGADASAVGVVNVTALSRCCTDAFEPIADVEVVSVDADGAQRGRVQTDAAGHAAVDVEAGGSVTAVYPLDAASGQRYIATFAAVEPGDELTFGDTFYDGTGAELGTMTVTWPAAANISYWFVYYDCGSVYVDGLATSTVLYRYDYAHCQGATTDIVLVGYDSSLGLYARHATLQDVTWVNTGVASFSGTLLGTNTVTFDVSGLPPEIDGIYTSANPISSGMFLPGFGVGGTPAAGAFTQTGQLLPVGDQTAAYLELQRTGDFGYQYTQRRLPASSTTIDWASPTILPWVGGSAANAAARTISWIQLGEQPYDVTVIDLYWSFTPGLFGVGSSTAWYLILPPGTDRVVLPELPDDLAALLPPDDTVLYPGITLIESELFDGYDAARTHPEWRVRCPNCVDLTETSVPTTVYSRNGGGG